MESKDIIERLVVITCGYVLGALEYVLEEERGVGVAVEA